MIMQYNNTNFNPPAPIIKTQISHPSGKYEEINFEMQIDSGADMTCIPESIVELIPNLRSGSINVLDYNGKLTTRITKYIIIVIGNQRLLTNAILVENEIGLLGRDILNKYRTILDGPNLKFNLEGNI